MWATGRPERNAAEAGFTLIEMLAVLGIMALIAGVTFAASGRLLTRAALGQARFDTLALLVEARADAQLHAFFDHQIKTLKKEVATAEDDGLKMLEQVETLDREAADIQQKQDAEQKAKAATPPSGN